MGRGWVRGRAEAGRLGGGETENGLTFQVQGYKHTGRVEVVYDEGWDLFIVRTINLDGTIKEQQEGIYADGLVDCIDRLVEKTDDYSARVRNQYGL